MTDDVQRKMYVGQYTTYNTRTLPTYGASKKGTNEKETKWKKGEIANETWLALGGGVMGIGAVGVGVMGVGVMCVGVMSVGVMGVVVMGVGVMGVVVIDDGVVGSKVVWLLCDGVIG